MSTIRHTTQGCAKVFPAVGSPRSGPRANDQTVLRGGVVLCHGTLDSAAVASAHARCAHSYKLTSKLHGMCSAGLARTD